MKPEELVDEFKSHIEWEDDMDDTMLVHYLSAAMGYVKAATGRQPKQLIFMVAAILNDYRVPEKEMAGALDSLTPFFIQEVYTNGTTDEQA
ncbi:phage gp6-like head-tail connector protein [Lactobacillus sp. PFC-70]|uniref:head-tail connector protein n=1 Tax=Levilactobacillus namurensis TaxID=380393 RepID=UPI000463DEDD|nr:head-tail connector protein [Levilactobacillus namurensis]MCW3778508.1 phage gp6-like head-tail connector protein [Levilactobacillus namurensis]MDT7019571.1 head-tail connector protein [Levilactobacillus namurensis]PTM21537.1 phage gp6-like head-tail connector protein [Lactobacillus sp. PFC-70]WNN65841.1 head-tail connector protein [Levilactobacillus namurensis]